VASNSSSSAHGGGSLDWESSPTFIGREIMSNQSEVELDLAWEEVTFWQDFVVWSNVEHQKLPEPRVMEALEKAWQRYERALMLSKKPMES